MTERIKAFNEHLQREDHFDDALHQENLAQLEKEFHANNAGEQRNVFLSVRPRSFYEANDVVSLWRNTDSFEAVMKEAQDFTRKYEADVQFIFSHVQHHWHQFNDKGQRVPMKYCMPKGKKKTRKPVAPEAFLNASCEMKGKVRQDNTEREWCAKASLQSSTSRPQDAATC